MSRWIREHLGGLGFAARRAPPPDPPQPDYSAEPELPGSVVLAEPGLQKAYRAQRERDFADPYTAIERSNGFGESIATRPGETEVDEHASPPPSPGLTFTSPKYRLIRVHSKVASSEEHENPTEGLASTTLPCPLIENSSGYRKGTIRPPALAVRICDLALLRRLWVAMQDVSREVGATVFWSSDVAVLEEEDTETGPSLLLLHLYDTPHEPPHAEPPATAKRVRASSQDAAQLTTPPGLSSNPPIPASPAEPLAVPPSTHSPTPRTAAPSLAAPPAATSEPPSRESRLPQDDDRPAEEYDQPWEWKRSRISQAFAEVSCGEELPWPPPVGQLDGEAGPSIVPSGTESSSDGINDLGTSLEHGITRSEESLTEMMHTAPEKEPTEPQRSRVEGPTETQPEMHTEEPRESQARMDAAGHALGQHSWFHGDIGRAEAEQILQRHRVSSFLVRPSESDPRELSLSLRSTTGFVHMRMSCDQAGHVVLGENSPPFASVPEAVLFYHGRRLPVHGAEELSLMHPVSPSSSCRNARAAPASPMPCRPPSDDGLLLS